MGRRTRHSVAIWHCVEGTHAAHAGIVTKSSRGSGLPWLASLHLGQKARGVNPQGAGHLKELNHIEPTFAALHFRDEALGASELPCQLDLRQALRAAGVGQQAPETDVFCG